MPTNRLIAEFPNVTMSRSAVLTDEGDDGYLLTTTGRGAAALTVIEARLFSESDARAVWDAVLELGMEAYERVILYTTGKGGHEGEGCEVADLLGLLPDNADRQDLADRIGVAR